MKDNEIIALYWERKESAITATAEKYGSYCHTISYNILQDHSDAEECVNDTYLGAWKSMPPQRPDRLSVYLGKITRNLSINRFRQATAEKRGQGQVPLALAELEDCIPTAGGTEEIVETMTLTEALNRFLYSQPKERRSIFIRRYWYLDSIRDIAVRFDMSESKTASLLFRMRKELKHHLEKEGITL